MAIPPLCPPTLCCSPLASCDPSLTGSVNLILEYQKLPPFPPVSPQSSLSCHHSLSGSEQQTPHTHTPPTMAFSHPHLCCFSSWCAASPIILYNVSLTVGSLSRVGMEFCLLLHPKNQEKGPTHSRCLTYKLSCTEFNLWNWTGSFC